MSDDYYDDEDEPGGLWDPDAFTPPPTRPSLHIVAAPPPRTASIDPSTRPRSWTKPDSPPSCAWSNSGWPATDTLHRQAAADPPRRRGGRDPCQRRGGHGSRVRHSKVARTLRSACIKPARRGGPRRRQRTSRRNPRGRIRPLASPQVAPAQAAHNASDREQEQLGHCLAEARSPQRALRADGFGLTASSHPHQRCRPNGGPYAPPPSAGGERDLGIRLRGLSSDTARPRNAVLPSREGSSDR